MEVYSDWNNASKKQSVLECNLLDVDIVHTLIIHHFKEMTLDITSNSTVKSDWFIISSNSEKLYINLEL